MNKIAKIALSATLLLAVGTTSANADSNKGKKLFTKKLKQACDLTGATMAGKHTQGEWAEIGVGGMAAEIKTICPKIKDKALKEKYLNHYLDFFHEYGSDSGNVPSC